ncbi:NFACT family protein [bacterium]|nr:NFACT family protein [bacterium]
MDSFVIRAIVHELSSVLLSCQVTRVRSMVEPGLLLTFRSNQGERELLVSWSDHLSRLHLTGRNWPVARIETPMAQLLKKHVVNGTLLGIDLPVGERMVSFRFSSPLDKNAEINLTLQFFGVYTNLILWEGNSRTIITDLKQSIRTVDELKCASTDKGTSAPGKYNPFMISRSAFDDLRKTKSDLTYPLFLKRSFFSISQQTAELVGKFHEDSSATEWECFERLIHIYQHDLWSPAVGYHRSERGDLVPHRIMAFQLSEQDDQVTRFESFEAACDLFYSYHVHNQRIEILKKELLKRVKNELKKVEHTLTKLLEEQHECERHERFKKYGDLILTNLSDMQPRQHHLTVSDILSEPVSEVTIELDPSRTGVQNAQIYYKKASKLKRREAVIGERIARSDGKRERLQSLKSQIEDSSDLAYLESLQTVKPKDVVRPRKRSKKAGSDKKQAQHPFRRFQSTDGWLILVGRNNKENDLLTFQTAQPDDFFLHVRDYGGSHIIVKNKGRKQSMPAETLIEAATLAGHYSQGRTQPALDITVTQKKYVRKPKGFPPGKVLIEREKNIRVEMDRKMLERLFTAQDES